MTDNTEQAISVFDAYSAWKESEKKTEELHLEFSKIAEKAYDNGVRDVNGLILAKVESGRSKLDVVMFKTLHEDRYKQLVESGSVTIPISAIKEFEGEVSDCIDVKKTTYYTLCKPS